MSTLKRLVGAGCAAAVLLLSMLSMLPSGAQAAKVEKRPAQSQDDIFAALREAARRDDAVRAAELAARLPQYVLSSYVEYYRLKPRLRMAGAGEVRDFLQRHDGSAIADRLRNDWLLELGHRRDWAEFDVQYPLFVLNDDVQVKCYALLSQVLKGRHVADDARVLLTSPKDYGQACYALVAALAHDGQFTEDDIWAQMRLAGEQGTAVAARRMAALIWPMLEATKSALPGALPNALEGAIERPSFVLMKGVGHGRPSDRADHALFIIALGRTARSSPEQAARALTAALPQLTAPEQALAWAQIALQASYKLAPDAHAAYWSKTEGAPLSNEAYQWRVRMALRDSDWARVKSGINAMPPALRTHPAWVYWRSRALKAEGNVIEANRGFASLTDQVHFYAQLAQEELGLQIMVPAVPAPVTPDEVAPLAANAGFQRALKFFALDMRPEGIREWNWELRRLSERELLAAAELARRHNLLDRMVNTSDRTRHEFDFTQRYPTPFRDDMALVAQTLALDLAWVYGLVRQESRFVPNARSSVGALGLMQVMPATARFVARKIGLTEDRVHHANDTGLNIRIGAHYLHMMLKDLDGSEALATAAYNAGPGRPRAWRATLHQAVEGAVFVETIPFAETRGYVKNVLANATYYAALIENRPQSLKERLGVVAPKGKEAIPTEISRP